MTELPSSLNSEHPLDSFDASEAVSEDPEEEEISQLPKRSTGKEPRRRWSWTWKKKNLLLKRYALNMISKTNLGKCRSRCTYSMSI